MLLEEESCKKPAETNDSGLAVLYDESAEEQIHLSFFTNKYMLGTRGTFVRLSHDASYVTEGSNEESVTACSFQQYLDIILLGPLGHACL